MMTLAPTGTGDTGGEYNMYRALQYYAVANCDNRTQVHWDTSTLVTQHWWHLVHWWHGWRGTRGGGWGQREAATLTLISYQGILFAVFTISIYLVSGRISVWVALFRRVGGDKEGSQYINACHKARYLLPFSRHYIVDSPKLAKKVREGCSKGFQDQNFLAIVVN